VAAIAGLVVVFRNHAAVAAALSPSWLQWCGRACFSLYVLHQGVWVVFAMALGGPPDLPNTMIAFVFLFGLSALLSEGVEAPLRALGRRRWPRAHLASTS